MINNLIISSGGIILFSLIGSVKCLHDYNLLNNITNFYGISSGAIICTLLSLNYSINEIIDSLLKLNLLRFIDDYNLNNINNFGLSSGINKDIILKTIITYKLGENNVNYNFKQLFDDTGIKLHIYATCIDNKKLYEFSYKKNYSIPIWKALSASINIPLFFCPVKINNYSFIDGAIVKKIPFLSKLNQNNSIFIFNDNLYQFSNSFNNFYLSILNMFIQYKYKLLFKHTIHIKLNNKYSQYGNKFDINFHEKIDLLNLGYSITLKYITFNFIH